MTLEPLIHSEQLPRRLSHHSHLIHGSSARKPQTLDRSGPLLKPVSKTPLLSSSYFSVGSLQRMALIVVDILGLYAEGNMTRGLSGTVHEGEEEGACFERCVETVAMGK